VERVAGVGRIVAAGEVEVKGEGAARKLATRRILIATGSKPTALPGIPFGPGIVHSTDALSLADVPKRLLVIGAGVIGLELGSVWMRLGSEVTVLEFMDRSLPGMDRASAASLQRSLQRQGMRFSFGATARGARRQGDAIHVEVAEGQKRREIEADVVLVAIGRRPYTEGLGAAEVGVTLDAKGRVEVDGEYRTSVAGIYAVGDVIAGPMLAHKAEEEGIAAVERMAGQAGHVAYDCIPNVVYTWPEFASVGLSEEGAREAGREVKVGTFPFLANGRAKAMNEREGQVKILADARSDRIVGAHIVGPRASDIIAELATAMEMEASAEDVGRSVHAHPTLPEAIKEAALGVEGRAIHI
jgi:dihydrolipoamide dehydrogenase